MGAEIPGISDRLLAAVMNGTYQGILVTVLVALSFRVFSRTNAATRHAAWLCTLVLLVLLVVAHGFFHSPPPALHPGTIARTAMTPDREIGTHNAVAAAGTVDGMPVEIGSSGLKWPGYFPAEQERLVSQESDDSLALTSREPPDEVQEFSVGSLPPPGATRRGSGPNSPSIAVEPLAASTAPDQSAWFYTAMRSLANPVSLTLGLESRAARSAGVILLSVCLMWSVARLFRLLLRLHQIRKLKLQSFPASEAVNELFQGLVTRLGAGRKVVLKTSPAAQSSFVLGFLHPVILLPTEQMDPTDAEQILRHELAHVRRRDDWANLLQHFTLAAFPFHPAVWWISKRLSLEREIACDDSVLQSSARPHAYALLLANLAARMQRGPPLLAPGASNHKTQLQQRIDMILNTRRNTSPRLAATWLTFLASAAALFAVTAICLAPRIVLAQTEAAPAPANTQGSLLDDPPTPAMASVAAGFSPETGEAASGDAAPSPAPTTPAIGPGPKLKAGHSRAVSSQPAVVPAPPAPAVSTAPAVPAAPVELPAQPAPRMSRGSFSLSAASASDPKPEPRPGRTPRPARAQSSDSAFEERLERLEKMVESLMARGYATQNPYPLKQPADTVGPIDRKQIAEIEAQARHQAEMARKHELDERAKLEEHLKHEAARAAGQAKQAAADAEKIAREQKRQTRLRELQLKGITGTPGRRIAVINNLTFTQGEEGEVHARNGRIKIRVLEIRDKSVLLQIEGLAEPKELLLQEGSQKQLDELRKRLEILDRKREELDRQIEELERNQEQLDEPQDEERVNEAQSDTSEFNSDSTPNPRQ